jgi:cytochrome c-type biogenesis protein CcmH
MSRLKSFPAFLLVATLFFGAVITSQPSENPVSSRINHLTHVVRCPSCEGLSVAQSNATSSLAIRHEIERKVRAGVSDSDILTSLQIRYGQRILLTPPSRGLGMVLWLVPLGAVAAGIVVVLRVSRRGA